MGNYTTNWAIKKRVLILHQFLEMAFTLYYSDDDVLLFMV